jgi:hypothetical protein
MWPSVRHARGSGHPGYSFVVKHQEEDWIPRVRGNDKLKIMEAFDVP